MPTQRFFNLKEEKKNIIKKAIMEECARVPYGEISINQIIKSADISRGSFYTYFEDKDDMVKYLLDDFREICMNYIYHAIEEVDGDTITAAENMVLDIIKNAQFYPNAKAYRNILLNVGTITNIRNIGIEKMTDQNPIYVGFIKRCYELNNQEKCRFRDMEQLSWTIDLLLTLVLKHISEYYMIEQNDYSRIMKIMHEQLEIIRRGLQ